MTVVTAAQFDLFASPPVPGLSYADNLMQPDEEMALVGEIEAVSLTPFRFQGWLGKRVTASFGWNYDFDNAAFSAAEPIPRWLLPLRARVAKFAGLRADEFVQALIIRYDAGAGIGWHRDRPHFEHVIGISLGASAALRLRRRADSGFDRRSVLLFLRSIYHLSGEVRHNWEHSIAPMEKTRWSLTFRSLSDKGRQLIARA